MAKRVVFCIVFLCAFAKADTLTAQSLQGLSIQHDNDFLLGIDRYYTAGTFFTYSRELNSFLNITKLESPELRIRLGQETYTPRQVLKNDVNQIDRPYAGYLFIEGQISTAEANEITQVTAEFGLVGPQSGAKAIQLWYHDLINEFKPTWVGELENNWHLNFGYRHYKQLGKSSLYRSTQFQTGTRTVYGQLGGLYVLGKRDKLWDSSLFDRLGYEPEFYGYVAVYYRFVPIDALIEGHPIFRKSTFTKDAALHRALGEIGGAYRTAHSLFKAALHLHTKVTTEADATAYMSLAYTYQF